MWREYIQQWEHNPIFLPGATATQIAEVEAALQVSLPEDLKGLLSETNGVPGKYDISLIWSTDQLIARNREMRTPLMRANYLPFDHLLFFTSAGNGDQFAYGVIEGEVKYQRIYVWNHEDDSRVSVAWSLKDFLERSYNGKMLI
jgi:cell wall assembly regulator SMI1